MTPEEEARRIIHAVTLLLLATSVASKEALELAANYYWDHYLNSENITSDVLLSRELNLFLERERKTRAT